MEMQHPNRHLPTSDSHPVDKAERKTASGDQSFTINFWWQSQLVKTTQGYSTD
jgi:hypothetical protein